MNLLFSYLEKKKVLLVYIPLVLYWIILLTATSLPVKDLPGIGIGDKFSHFFAYFVLSVMLYLVFTYQRKSVILFQYSFIAAVLVASLYGIADELHQMLIPGRSAEIYDWIADLAGSLTGVLVVSYLKKKLNYIPEFS
jgi:VanZ family protein